MLSNKLLAEYISNQKWENIEQSIKENQLDAESIYFSLKKAMDQTFSEAQPRLNFVKSVTRINTNLTQKQTNKLLETLVYQPESEHKNKWEFMQNLASLEQENKPDAKTMYLALKEAIQGTNKQTADLRTNFIKIVTELNEKTNLTQLETSKLLTQLVAQSDYDFKCRWQYMQCLVEMSSNKPDSGTIYNAVEHAISRPTTNPYKVNFVKIAIADLHSNEISKLLSKLTRTLGPDTWELMKLLVNSHIKPDQNAINEAKNMARASGKYQEIFPGEPYSEPAPTDKLESVPNLGSLTAFPITEEKPVAVEIPAPNAARPLVLPSNQKHLKTENKASVEFVLTPSYMKSHQKTKEEKFIPKDNLATQDYLKQPGLKPGLMREKILVSILLTKVQAKGLKNL